MSLTSLMQAYPIPGIIIFGVIVSLAITIVNKLIVNQERLKELRAKQKACQEDMKKCKDNPQKMMEIQKEMMSHMGESMKHSMLPMLITFIPLILLFGWLRGIYTPTGLEPILKGWIWYYIGASLVSSLIFRKVFNMA